VGRLSVFVREPFITMVPGLTPPIVDPVGKVTVSFVAEIVAPSVPK
jgi:hypothetical protein